VRRGKEPLGGVLANMLHMPVVVACNHNLVRVRQLADVLVEIAQRREAAARAKSDVARVAEDVAWWYCNVLQLVVRIRDEHHAQA